MTTARTIQEAAQLAWKRASDAFNKDPSQKGHDFAADLGRIAQSPELAKAISSALRLDPKTDGKRLKPAKRGRVSGMLAVTGKTYAGTPEIVDALVRESSPLPAAWRPVRAAAARALALREAKGHVWMTTAELLAWVEPYGPRKRNTMLREAGVKVDRVRGLLAGAEVRVTEALAIAHYRAGLPLPCEIESGAFAAWFYPRFGGANTVAAFLGVNQTTIAGHARGFSINNKGRVRRRPQVLLVRALDWLWRVGPTCPYGDRLAVDFPGQMEGEG